MRPEPRKATPPAQAAEELPDDPLVERLRSMDWPEPDAATRERLLEDFQARMEQRGAVRATDDD